MNTEVSSSQCRISPDACSPNNERPLFLSTQRLRFDKYIFYLVSLTILDRRKVANDEPGRECRESCVMESAPGNNGDIYDGGFKAKLVQAHLVR